MTKWIWILPLLPFLGAFLNGVALRGRVSKKVVSWVACGLVGLTALFALVIVGGNLGSEEFASGEGFEKSLYVWVPAGMMKLVDGGFAELSIELGFLLDPLSAVMLLVVWVVISQIAWRTWIRRHVSACNNAWLNVRFREAELADKRMRHARLWRLYK